VTPATVRVRPPGRRAGTLALVVLLVVAALGSVVVLATRIGPVVGQRGTDERRSQVLQQAKQAAVNFTTLDYESFDEDVELVLDGSTGTFREQFRAGVDDVRELVTQNRSRSVGTVREAALVSDDDDSARVLVVVDTEVTNVASTTPVPRHYRIQMDLTRTGDTWLVSDLTFVSSQVELPGGVADPGATPAPTTSAPTTSAPGTGTTP
jgi:Mce-associated membrane protein